MTHLHVHSNHSLLEGVAGLRQLVGRAVEHGMKSLALTDTNGLYGAIPFYQAAKDAGVRPIIGAELDGLVLLARNREGYARLCEIVSARHLDDDFRLVDLLRPDDPLFVIDNRRRRIEALYERGVRPLVALTHWGDGRSHYQADGLHAFAQRLGLRPVAVNPVYFLDPQDVAPHRVLSAIRLNTTVDNLRAQDIADDRAWFRSPKELERLYKDWPQAVENLEWAAEECDLELQFGTPRFPSLELPGGETAFSHLWKLAFEGARRRYHPLTPEVTNRLHEELDVIHRLGFAPYFLIVEDIVRFATERGIPIMGRGSAANSLVSYALGMTRADPLKYDLYFERFLNPSRTDCPDIDLDICWRRRDEVLNYVYARYGGDYVAMICTLTTLQARSAVREVAKAYGLTNEEAGEITRNLPHYRASDIRAIVNHIPEARGLRIDEEPLKSIVTVSERIDGFPRHLSIHSGGVVIAPEPLTRFTPLQRSTKGIIITQYDMDPIEDLGLVKMDLLGHRSLTVIDETVAHIWDNRGVRVDVEALPEPDALTGELLRAGRTIGCFQIESPAMRALLSHTLADNTDMLIKTLSLVRPGPSGSGMKKRFIDRHLGREETTYLHPALEGVLGDTYGVMLYQEDILKVAHAVAGMSLAEADMLRRAMTKKRSPREMAKIMKAFVEKAKDQGVDEDAAARIGELIANFAAYSYCKAHASSYGEVSYQCAYLKAHYPAEFMAAVITNRGGYYHTAVYVEEARRMGAETLPPGVNQSRYGYTVEGEAIRVGFQEIRRLTQQAVRSILEAREERPFTSLSDLLGRTGIQRSDAEALVQAGACDGFGRTRPALLWELKLLLNDGKPLEGGERLFAAEGVESILPQLPDYSSKRRTDLEWEHLGLLATTHPLRYYLPLLTDRAFVLSDAMAEYAGRAVTMAGWLVAERRVPVKDQGAMKFLTFEDPAGVFEGVVFPRAYQEYGHLLKSQGPFFVTGEVQEEDHYCSILVDAVELAERP